MAAYSSLQHGTSGRDESVLRTIWEDAHKYMRLMTRRRFTRRHDKDR